LHVEGSKGHRGALKPRTVPLKRALAQKLQPFCNEASGLLFPFWDGTKEGEKKASSRLSARFRTLFQHTGVADMTEHDLRHEATCRWFELRDPNGRWALSDVEVCRIMGWASLSMVLRYASLRGEDLAARIDW
jgi:integrase